MFDISLKRIIVLLVALLSAVVSPTTVQASTHATQPSVAGSGGGDFQAGRDFIKAAVFGIGPMTDDVSRALDDPEFDAFLASRVDTAETNAHLDAFLAAYAKRRPGLVERVGAASRSGDPYALDVATAKFLDQMRPVAKQLAAKSEKAAAGKSRAVAPDTAHSLAVVPIAVALAAYMYAAAAHTAGVAIQVGAGFAYWVYNKVHFWGASDGQTSELEHEELMLRLAEGLAAE